MDNLLRTLVHAKPHFVRCLRPNAHDSLAEFDRALVSSQVRSLQVAETVNLMAGGFPHRMRFKAFAARYRPLAVTRGRRLFWRDEKAVNDCETVLDCYSDELRIIRAREEETTTTTTLPRNTAWAHGRKHIFLSEGARQLLERMREERRTTAARRIQRNWRRWHSNRAGKGFNNNNSVQPKPAPPPAMQRGILMQHQPGLRSSQQHLRSSTQRPRPQPIMGTPPPMLDSGGIMQVDRCDFKTIQQTCSLFGLDLVSEI